MEKNMGLAYRSVRILMAAIIVALYFFHVVSGTIGIAQVVVAGILMLTSIISIIPLYPLLDIRSCACNT